jgi:hypothetical protein
MLQDRYAPSRIAFQWPIAHNIWAELQRALDTNVADQEANKTERTLGYMIETCLGLSLSDAPAH